MAGLIHKWTRKSVDALNEMEYQDAKAARRAAEAPKGILGNVQMTEVPGGKGRIAEDEGNSFSQFGPNSKVKNKMKNK